MVCVVIGARKLGVNPDNIATPIAASLGDLITLSILAFVSNFFYKYKGRGASKEEGPIRKVEWECLHPACTVQIRHHRKEPTGPVVESKILLLQKQSLKSLNKSRYSPASASSSPSHVRWDALLKSADI